MKRRVFLNVASSIDGRIASVGREKFRFGSAEDRRLMQELRATADAVVMATAPADMTLALELLYSIDGGLTWQPMSGVQRGAIAANRWSNHRVLGNVDVPAGSAMRITVRLSRDGAAETADLSHVRCVLRATIGNRDPTSSPYDTGETGDER